MSIVNIMQPIYRSFRKQVDFIFEDEQPQTKEALKLLMYQRGMRQTKEQRLHPTDRQVELAWEYVQSKYQTVKLEEIFFKTERYKKHIIYRATKTKEIDGKKYRAGQFIPHKVKK